MDFCLSSSQTCFQAFIFAYVDPHSQITVALSDLSGSSHFPFAKSTPLRGEVAFIKKCLLWEASSLGWADNSSCEFSELFLHRGDSCYSQQLCSIKSLQIANPWPWGKYRVSFLWASGHSMFIKACLGPAVVCGFLTSGRTDFIMWVRVIMRVCLLKLGTVKQGRA